MITSAQLVRIREDLNGAAWGRRSAIVANWSALLSVSPEQLRRALRAEFGPKFIRKDHPSQVSDELVREIAKVKMEGLLLTKGSRGVDRELATEAAIDILIERGHPGAESLRTIDPATGEVRYKDDAINRRMASAGFRDEDPRRRRESEHPNQVWRLDFSRSKYFQVLDVEPGGKWLLRVTSRPLPNKAVASRRTWAVGVIDDASRVLDVRYYVAAGESWAIGLDMLRSIWTRPADDPNPMRHLPDALVCDNGAFKKRSEVVDLMKRLLIDLPGVTPGNHSAQGKIENRWHALWQTFELATAVRLREGTVVSLDELNDMAADHIMSMISKPHPLKRGLSIIEAYQRGVQMTIQRACPIDPAEHAFRCDERVVDGCCLLSWGGLQYQAPAWAQNQRVRVWSNLAGDVYVESLDKYRPPSKAIPPKEGDNYPYMAFDSFSGTPRHTYRQEIEAEVKAGAKRPPAPREREFAPSSPASPAPEKPAFANADLARQWIGLQIGVITGGQWGYEDFRDEFDPLLSVDLGRGPIDAKLETLRAVMRQQTMGVVR